MKKLIIIVMVSLLAAITACTSAGTTTTTTSSTSTSTVTTTTPGQAPVYVVSVTGPMPPINPGGPTVQIILENDSAEPVVYLTATLGVSGGPPGSNGFTFNFDVTEANPLAPGNTVTSQMTLIGGGFGSDVLYPLTINGSYEESGPFTYTLQVYISPPVLDDTGS